MSQKVSSAFVATSWVAMSIGLIGYIIGLWRSEMLLNEKGYYFTLIMFGLFAVVSLQKSVRDRLEGIAVTDIYYSICWFGTVVSIVLLVIGLWNADLLPSEKGFYAFAFLLSLFGAVAVQKNTRDNMYQDKLSEFR
jgi:uncharacterized membrane protein YiaA